MKLRKTSPEHEVAYQDMVDLLRRHQHLPSSHMLAIAANMLGKMIAMQDQRTMSPARAMEIVVENIQEGNQQVLRELQDSRGTS